MTGPPTAPVSTSQDADTLVAAAVTALFVPGDRPDRFAKATGSGADMVIIDLEDAVVPAAKPHALASVLDALASPAQFRALVRVNGVGSPTHDIEIRALLDLLQRPGHGLLGIMVPKAENSETVGALGAELTARAGCPVALIPLVESALGVVNALPLARIPGVTRLAFGAIDLALDLDLDDSDSRVLDYGRAQVVVASRAAGITAPLDSPSTQITDLQAVARDARRAHAGGFGGKLCIHPHQLTPIMVAFTPTDAQLTWARSVVSAGDAAVQVDGQMIDRPVTQKARRILHRAGEVSA